MPRKKKSEPTKVETAQAELELDLETGLEEQADLLEPELDEEIERIEADDESDAVEPKAVATEADAAAEPEPPTLKAAASKEASVPLPTPAKTEDPLAQQWDAARRASEAMTSNLEKVNALLRELPEHYATVLNRQNKTPKATPAARVAFGMSMLATVLSVLSLSFSQSARHAALDARPTVPAVHRVTEPAQAPVAAPKSVQKGPAKAESEIATRPQLRNKRLKKKGR